MDKNLFYREKLTDKRKYRIGLSTTILRTINDSVQIESTFSPPKINGFQCQNYRFFYCVKPAYYIICR